MNDERALYDVFHETLDRVDVSGPFQRLQIEIEKPGAARRPRGRRIYMTRSRLALLAAALVLVIGVSVVISARVFMKPVGETINASPDQATVMQLLARKLHLQHPASAVTCPDGPYAKDRSYGLGPVYGVGGEMVSSAWGTYWNVGVLVDKGTAGPIVVRGEDIVLGWPLVFLGPYGSGSVYGSDTLDGTTVKQYTTLVLDTSHPPTNWFWQFRQGFKHSWSGCVGFQVDGPNFSEQFYSAGPST